MRCASITALALLAGCVEGSSGLGLPTGDAGPASSALRILTETLPPAVERTAYEVRLTAAGGRTPYRFGVLEGRLPAGLGLRADGTIGGVPEETGAFVLGIQVVDAAGATATREYGLVVVPSGSSDALQIVTDTLPDGAEGASYSAPVAARGGRPPYTWSAEGLPLGLAVDAAGTPQTTLHGTPLGFTEEPVEILVRVRDAEGTSAQRSLQLSVRPRADRVRVLTEALPEGLVGATYETPLAAAGGRPPYRWRVRRGATPQGLAVAVEGAVRGRPERVEVASFEVEVEDAAGVTARRSLVLAIREQTLPPDPQITTAALEPARICRGYARNVSAHGGAGEYTWQVTDGALPPGLELSPEGTPSARIYGYPEAPGTYTFEIAVLDRRNQRATRSMTLEVLEAPDPRRWVALEGRITTGPRDVFVSDLCFEVPTPAQRVMSGDGELVQGTAQMSRDGRRLAFIWYDDAPNTGREIYLVDLGDGAVGAPCRVHGPLSAREDARLSLSPDGRWVAYARDRNVYLVFVDDPEAPPAPRVVEELPPRGYPPTFAWSPDDRWLVFSSGEHVYVVDLTRVATPEHIELSAFVSRILWHPSGRGFALTTSEDVAWVEPGRGTAPTLVDGIDEEGEVRAHQIGFSGDGRWLAFAATLAEGRRGYEVFAVYLDGPAPAPPVRVSGALPSALNEVSGFAWSPAGARLGYIADQELHDRFELYAADLSGLAPAPPAKVSLQLQDPSDVQDVVWAPDGRWLGYTVSHHAERRPSALLVDLATPTPWVLPVDADAAGLGIYKLAFAPRSNQLALRADTPAEGAPQLYYADLRAGTPGPPVQVNPPLAEDGQISWRQDDLRFRPDESALLYLAEQVDAERQEAWSVSVLSGAPGTAHRLHTPGWIERIVLPAD